MNALYVETSALLTWIFSEPRSGEVKDQIDSADQVVTSVLTQLEAARALVRFQQQRKVKEADLRRSCAQIDRLLASWTMMEITSSIRRRAGQPFPVEPLRALDAVHLATALEFVSLYSDLRVLSFDQRVVENLPALGLAAA